MMKQILTKVDCEKARKLKHLAVDKDLPVNDLVNEAIDDLLSKYGDD